MGRSRTWYLKTSEIASQPELAPVLLRLMFAVNDLSLANSAIEDWEANTEQKRQGRKRGAQSYFVRILMSHLYEALTIIKEIAANPLLRASVDAWDARTVASFKVVEAFANSNEIKSLDRLRNRAIFHYDRQFCLESFREIADLDPNRDWSCSVGSDSLDWHFELADAVMDRMMIRQVLRVRVPRGPERTKQTHALALRQQEIAREFTGFRCPFRTALLSVGSSASRTFPPLAPGSRGLRSVDSDRSHFDRTLILML